MRLDLQFRTRRCRLIGSPADLSQLLGMAGRGFRTEASMYPNGDAIGAGMHACADQCAQLEAGIEAAILDRRPL